MSNVYTIFKNETISNKSSFFGWLIGIGISFLLIMLMYPGDEGMASMLNLLEDEYFQAFLGDIGGSDPGYALWIAMMFPFISMIFVRLVTLEIPSIILRVSVIWCTC